MRTLALANNNNNNNYYYCYYYYYYYLLVNILNYIFVLFVYVLFWLSDGLSDVHG